MPPAPPTLFLSPRPHAPCTSSNVLLPGTRDPGRASQQGPGHRRCCAGLVHSWPEQTVALGVARGGLGDKGTVWGASRGRHRACLRHREPPSTRPTAAVLGLRWPHMSLGEAAGSLSTTPGEGGPEDGPRPRNADT